MNLVQIDQNEITDVAALSSEKQRIDADLVSLGDLTPKYSLSASGNRSSTEINVFSQSFGIGAQPLPWLNGSTNVDPINFFFFRGTAVEWWFHTWGIPSTDHFFSNMPYMTTEAYSGFYEQWFKGPDMSVSISGVSAKPGIYDGQTATVGDSL